MPVISGRYPIGGKNGSQEYDCGRVPGEKVIIAFINYQVVVLLI